MSTTAGITRLFLDSVRRDTLLVLLYVAHVFHSMCLDVSVLNCERAWDKLKKIIKWIVMALMSNQTVRSDCENHYACRFKAWTQVVRNWAPLVFWRRPQEFWGRKESGHFGREMVSPLSIGFHIHPSTFLLMSNTKWFVAIELWLACNFTLQRVNKFNNSCGFVVIFFFGGGWVRRLRFSPFKGFFSMGRLIVTGLTSKESTDLSALTGRGGKRALWHGSWGWKGTWQPNFHLSFCCRL